MAGRRKASPKRQVETAQKQQDELQDLHARLADRVEALTESDAWRAWLDVAARFHAYSLNNTLLITAQRPNATLVAGYRDWQKLGRQVRKGEGGSNAIRIMAPVRRRVPIDRQEGRNERGTGEDTNDTGADRDARNQRTEVRVVGYKPTSVFDVSQTDGEPLPERPRPELLDGAAPEGLWESLEQFATNRGWDVGYEHLTDGSNGYTDFGAHTIRVHDDLAPAHAVKTLAHEVGHALLHVGGDQPVSLHRGVAEVEAESVAHLVLGAHGADTDAYTFDYVTGWASRVAGQEPPDVVRATGERVLATARTVLDHTLDERLDPDAVQQQRDRARDAARETSMLADRAELRTATAATVNQPRPARARDSDRAVGRPMTTTWASNEPELFTADPVRQRLVSANRDAAAFYRDQLRGNESARTYLHERLGEPERLPSGVRLGYAPDGWTGVLDHLRTVGYDDRTLLEAGLVQQTSRGTLIDRFRDRVLVGLHDQHGDLAGFIGRPPHDNFDQRTPKYVNTPSTAVFDKGKVVFGLHEQHEALDHGAHPVLVEGPFDALALSAAAAADGEQHIAPVATSGTAVTPHHLAAIHTAADSQRLVLGLDSDTTGQQAQAQAAELALDLPRTITAVTLPDGHDPASWVAAHNSDPASALRPYLDPDTQTPAAALVIDQRITNYFANHPPQHRQEVEGQLGALRAAAPVLARLDQQQATEQGLRVTNQLNLDPGTVAETIGQARHDAQQSTKRVHDRAATAAQQTTGSANAARHAGRERQPASHRAPARGPVRR